MQQKNKLYLINVLPDPTRPAGNGSGRVYPRVRVDPQSSTAWPTGCDLALSWLFRPLELATYRPLSVYILTVLQRLEKTWHQLRWGRGNRHRWTRRVAYREVCVAQCVLIDAGWTNSIQGQLYASKGNKTNGNNGKNIIISL